MNEPKCEDRGGVITSLESDVLELVRMLRKSMEGWRKALAERDECGAKIPAAAQTIAAKEEAIVQLNAERSKRGFRLDNRFSRPAGRERIETKARVK